MAADLDADGGLGNEIRAYAASGRQQIVQICGDETVIGNLVPRFLGISLRQIVLKQIRPSVDVHRIVALADTAGKLLLAQQIHARQIIFRMNPTALTDSHHGRYIGNIRIVKALEIFLVKIQLAQNERLAPDLNLGELQRITSVRQVKELRIVECNTVLPARCGKHLPVCHILLRQIPVGNSLPKQRL